MDLERLYRRAGFFLSAGVAIAFLVCVYAWLSGLRAPRLDTPFQAFLIAFLLWLVASPGFIRAWRKGVLLLAVALAVLLIIPSFLLGNSFLQLFIPSSMMLKAAGVPPMVPDNWFFLFFSGLYVLIIAGIGRFAALGTEMGPAFRQRTLVLTGTFLVLLFVPEMMTIRIIDKLYREWYGMLLNVRGEYVPHWSQVALLDVQVEMREKRLRDILGTLAQSDPALVIVTSWTEPTFPDSVRKHHNLEVISPGWRSDTASPAGMVTADGSVPSWRYEPGERLSIYYRPVSPGGIDIGVKAVHAALKKRENNPTLVTGDQEVQVASRVIPLLPGGRVLINYYRNYERVSVLGTTRTDRIPPFPMFWYWEWPEEETVTGYVHGRGTRLRVNYEKRSLEDRIGKKIVEREGKTSWQTREWESVPLSDLQGKILVVNVGGRFDLSERTYLSTGFVYACIIQNILDENFLKEPRAWVTVFLTLFVSALITSAFLKYNVYKASLMVLGGCVVGGIILIFIFLWSSTLVNPYPLIIPVAGAILFMLPIGISADRRLLFQEQSRLQAELRTAHDMQMGLMPVADPVVKGYDISGLCVPANEVGGDFYDYVWLDRKQTKFGIALADVSGKAMKAAMTAVMTSGMIYRELGSNGTPKAILRRINKPMYAKLDQRMFTAMSLAAIDLRTKELTLSNAGQVHPLMLRNGQVQRLKVEGERLPLGVMEEVRYEELKFKLKKNDTIVFFTDGVVEAMNGQRDLYGTERLEQELLSAGGFTAKALREHIVASVGKFAGKAEQHDDMTVVVVRVL